MISGRLKIDHYRYPLYFLLFVGGWEPSFGRYRFSGTLRDGEGSK